MFVQSSRHQSKNWLRGTNIKSNLTPRVECTLKPSNYDAKPWLLHFAARKSKCPRCFWEIDPEILHTRLMCPCRAFTKGIFLFFFVFSLEIEDPFKIQISQKMQKPKHLAKKKRKNSNSKRLGKGILNTLCKISGSISQKRRGHWTLKEFGVLCFVKK